MNRPEPTHSDSGSHDSEKERAPEFADDSAAESPEPTLAEQLEAARAERDVHQDRVLRAQAELENFRKRSRAEGERNLLHGSAALIRDLLPALDNLDRAIAAADSSRDADQLIDGVRLVARQFRDILAARDVEEIPAVGEQFDPNLHEAIQQIPSAEYPRMTVLDEIEKGYKLRDHVIRPSKVIVSAGADSG